MSEHARLSFSASERWLRCPASVNMTKDIPDTGGSEAAEEGTFAHRVLERSGQNWMMLGDEKIVHFAHLIPDDLKHLIDVDEMHGHLQKCMDYVIERYELLPGKNKGISFESRVDLHYMTGRDDLWGTSDIQIWTDDYIDTIDLKYGKGIFVDADTSQNRLYTLAKMCEFMKKLKGDVPWVSVRGTIMQPRFADEDGEIFRFTDYDPNELMKWFETDVLPAVGLSDVPPAPNPGVKQCRFCLAKPTCPAARRQVDDVCSVFEAQIVEVQPDGTSLTIDPIDTLDIEQLLEIHDKIPFINGYLKSVSERIRKLLEARDPRLHERLKLVVSRRNTDYSVEDDEVMEKLTAGKGRTVKDGYIPKKNFIKEKLLSASQMLKLKLNDAQKARLQEMITKSEGSLSIVPWSDPRDNAFPPIPFEEQGKVASAQPSTEYDFL